MKILKSLLIGFALIGMLTFSANAQGVSSRMEQYPILFWCGCAGEYVGGTVSVQMVVNANLVHHNVKTERLVGLYWDESTQNWMESGNEYTFTRVVNYRPETGELVLNMRNVRTVGEVVGLVTKNQVKGPAEMVGVDFIPLDGAKITIVCH